MTRRKTNSYDFLQQHSGLVVVLFLGFMMRSYLSTWPSYWHDEYLSIYYYGTYYDNVFSSIRALARSVHPPLYQFVLYNWISHVWRQRAGDYKPIQFLCRWGDAMPLCPDL